MNTKYTLLAIIIFCTMNTGCLFPAKEVASAEIKTVYKDLDNDGCYDAFEVQITFKKENGKPCRLLNISSTAVVHIYPTYKEGTELKEGEPIYQGVTIFEDSDDANFVIEFEYVNLNFDLYKSDRFIVYSYVEIGDKSFTEREVLLWDGLCHNP
ncbi:MAG: hypothetical protein PVF58_14850 [Candidatus Methanofastidiosia archaeon]